jgi:hypothetical protein
MANSIYCSPTHLKLVTGDADARTVKVRKHAEILLPAGGMINGIITDAELMTRFFAQVNNDYALGREETMLVINNNNIQAKKLEVPPVSDDMVLEFIRREYSQGEEDGDGNVYDYAALGQEGPNGGAQILAVGASRELLTAYRSALAEAGFNLKKIDIGLNCQIKLARFLPQLQQGSVILALIDGRTLSLTLFEEGTYTVSNRYRLVHGADDPEWTDEIGGNISSMIQFNKTLKDSAAVTAAYIAGVPDAQISALKHALGYLGIGIEGLDFSEHISVTGDGVTDGSGALDFNARDYVLNIGNLLKR